jgi:hypothetical protein
MTTIYAKTHEEKSVVAEQILNTKGGVTVEVTKGKRKKKSYDQDRLENMWHGEAAAQLADETTEEKRGYCKLHFGVPILRGENDEFREAYDRVIRPLTYEQKLQCMMVPLDFPVTRLMKSGQKARYLSDVQLHYQKLGVVLTIPNDDELPEGW